MARKTIVSGKNDIQVGSRVRDEGSGLVGMVRRIFPKLCTQMALVEIEQGDQQEIPVRRLVLAEVQDGP